jgi:hypothetical protein
MSMPAREALPRPPVFNAVSAGLMLLSIAWVLLIVATPQGPVDMMVPWLRSVSLMQALIGAACVALIWFRQGWAFYVYVGLILLGVLLGLVLHYAIPLLFVGPVLLALYLWALHAGGTGSMWRQMFGGARAAGPGLAYGAAPAMPPPLPTFAAPLPPNQNPVPPRAGAAMAPAAARPAGLDPLEALKRLGALRDSGAITDTEFAAKKAELLKRL